MKELAVIIPAVKKNVAFPDDLVKKLQGKTLIQRTIDQATPLVSTENIFVVTDSQEISLICERQGIPFFFQPDFKLSEKDLLAGLHEFLQKLDRTFAHLLVLFPYTPTLKPDIIRDAFSAFLKSDSGILFSVKKENHRIFNGNRNTPNEVISEGGFGSMLIEVRGFIIVKASLISNNLWEMPCTMFPLDEKTVEIKNYQDWWVCEKLLTRKRIVFRVIGNKTIGMGHIYRSLSLAHEISDHEIIFVCDNESNLAVQKIAGADYLIETAPESALLNLILNLKPDLVVNDMLSTNSEYIFQLKKAEIRVVNFEDTGSGAREADLTFNEIFEKKLFKGQNIFWGSRYLFLRDEFLCAKPRVFQEKVENILITFGGVDDANLTQKTLELIFPFIKETSIRVFIILGEGFPRKNQIIEYVESLNSPNLEISPATGVISRFMESADMAICANGRTVYELAHMHVPAIVLPQNPREITHTFSCEENGFIRLGMLEEPETQQLLMSKFEKLLTDTTYRRMLHTRMTRFNFLRNKKKVLRKILGFLTPTAS